MEMHLLAVAGVPAISSTRMASWNITRRLHWRWLLHTHSFILDVCSDLKGLSFR